MMTISLTVLAVCAVVQTIPTVLVLWDEFDSWLYSRRTR